MRPASAAALKFSVSTILEKGNVNAMRCCKIQPYVKPQCLSFHRSVETHKNQNFGSLIIPVIHEQRSQ